MQRIRLDSWNPENSYSKQGLVYSHTQPELAKGFTLEPGDGSGALISDRIRSSFDSCTDLRQLIGADARHGSSSAAMTGDSSGS